MINFSSNAFALMECRVESSYGLPISTWEHDNIYLEFTENKKLRSSLLRIAAGGTFLSTGEICIFL